MNGEYITAIGYKNLGSDSYTLTMSLQKLVELTWINNSAYADEAQQTQRPLDGKHAQGLAMYILKGLISSALADSTDEGIKQELKTFERTLGKLIHYSLQPIVVNIQAKKEDLQPKDVQDKADMLVGTRFTLPPDVTCEVIDGQHRREGTYRVSRFLEAVINDREYPRKASLFPVEKGKEKISKPEVLKAWNAVRGMLRQCAVSVEAHINLNVDEARQLFHDLNNLGKKVSQAIALDYDSSNPVSNFIKEELIDKSIISAKVDFKKDVTDWSKNDGSFAFKDLVAINSILFLNKTNSKSATPLQVDLRKARAKEFWKAINSINGWADPDSKISTVASQPVVMKALAKLAYDLNPSSGDEEAQWDLFIEGIKSFDFSHENELWRFQDLDKSSIEDKHSGISKYLPAYSHDERRKLGREEIVEKHSVKHTVFRFNRNHNDLIPIIGDLVRFQLKLPER